MTAFGRGQPFTFGVEEEFQLLDPDSGELVSRMDQIIATDDPIREQGVQSELFQSVVETATPVCKDLDDAREAIGWLRSTIIERAEQEGLAIAAAGTHPFALYEEQTLTDNPRYQALVDDIGWPVKRDLTFGLHVHVAVPSGEAAVAAMNHLRTHIPLLLALSANAPFWRGQVTGLHSVRVRIFGTMPRSGLPRRFEHWDELEATLATLQDGGVMSDVTKLWWDIRPRPDLGTVEIRICDACTEAQTTLALAGLTQALVAQATRARPPGSAVPAEQLDELLTENRWRAIRDGIHAEFLRANDQGIVEQVPLAQALDEAIEGAHEEIEEFGLKQPVSALREVAQRGETGADRQLAVYEGSGDLRAVSLDLIERTRRGSAP